MSGGYAGDIMPRDAWAKLQDDPDAVLVDVRTLAEWRFVGVPNLAEVDREPVLIEWQRFPDGVQNAAFVDQLREELGEGDPQILFLCRSGARSAAAAAAATAAGYSRCYNIAEGFEGDPNPARQRGQVGGWKFAGLPWHQN